MSLVLLGCCNKGFVASRFGSFSFFSCHIFAVLSLPLLLSLLLDSKFALTLLRILSNYILELYFSVRLSLKIIVRSASWRQVYS